MAKSLRSKVKRDFRSKKREQGVYAASAAARLNRLNAKLKSVVSQDLEDEDPEGQDEVPAQESLQATHIDDEPDSMQEDAPKKISTHGPRGSRREEWRLSKGMSARASSKGMNRQGGVAAKRKAGRSKRRR